MGYVRQSRVARSTGTRVEVLDAYDDASVFDADEGGRWVTMCDPHDQFVQHPTLALALSHAADPAGWCELCMAAELPCGPLTVQDVLVATDLWHPTGPPERATGIEWIGYDHVDPIPVVEAVLRDPALLDTVEDDQLFRWDYTGRNDAPALSTAGYTVSTYPRDRAPF